MKRIVFLFVVAFSVLALAESHGYRHLPGEFNEAASLQNMPLADENLLYNTIGVTALSADEEGFQYTHRNQCDLDCPQGLDGNALLPTHIR
jgi:hypothetical protein